MKKMMAIVTGVLFSLSGFAYEFDQMGRTDVDSRKCKIEMDSEKATFLKYSPGTIFGRHKVTVKIELEEFDSEVTDYDMDTNQKFVKYYTEKRSGLVKEYKLIYLYFNDDNTLDRYLAVKKHEPVIGRTTTEAVSCIFRK